jgi:hypothetical protein
MDSRRGVNNAIQSQEADQLRLVIMQVGGFGSGSCEGWAGVSVLEAHETEPSRWTALLEEALRDNAVDQDHEILTAAKALLEKADPTGSAAGKYTIDLRGAQAVQVGDHGQMTVTFGGPVASPGTNPGS